MIMLSRITITQAYENNIRKISMKIVPHELRENEIEKEITIHLTQCVLNMYRDYLERKRRENNIKKGFSSNNDINGDYSMECTDEENKDSKDDHLGAGDKYIIRKLVSLKISPEHIEDYSIIQIY